jgi:hypothetical protein
VLPKTFQQSVELALVRMVNAEFKDRSRRCCGAGLLWVRTRPSRGWNQHNGR